MRILLKEKYVLPYYMDDLLDQFLDLRQNTSTVTEYKSQFEALMLQCEIDEEKIPEGPDGHPVNGEQDSLSTATRRTQH